MDWLRKIFTDKVDLGRVNQFGIAIMAIGLLVVVLSQRIAKWIFKDNCGNKAVIVKLIGLLICAAGALIAIVG